jgi:hypothetical protein
MRSGGWGPYDGISGLIRRGGPTQAVPLALSCLAVLLPCYDPARKPHKMTSRSQHQALGLPKLQNGEPSKPLFFTNFSFKHFVMATENVLRYLKPLSL